MNKEFQKRDETKTAADRTSRELALQAADAFRKGNFGLMNELSNSAEAKRTTSHIDFFTAGVRALNNELNAKQTTTAKPQTVATAQNGATRRVFKIAR